MSIEEALAANTAAMTKNNELLEKLLDAAVKVASGAKAGASTEEGEKPKRTTAKKKEDEAGDTAKAVTLDDVKPLLSGWLNEFPKNGDEDHPETAARKAAFKGALEKLGAASLPAVPADKLDKLKAWAEAQIAKGRLVPDEDASSGDDDMLG